VQSTARLEDSSMLLGVEWDASLTFAFYIRPQDRYPPIISGSASVVRNKASYTDKCAVVPRFLGSLQVQQIWFCHTATLTLCLVQTPEAVALSLYCNTSSSARPAGHL